MKSAGKAANAAAYVKTSVVGKKTGEYSVYLTGSKTPFVTMFRTM